MDRICEHNSCTGCAACASICPVKCIQMESDEEGFLRPVISKDKCINCQKCKNICPINNEYVDDKKIPRTFAGRIRDSNILSESSSGGIFTAFAEEVIKEGGYVIAAGFDKQMNVIHKVCDQREELDELRKSKYVQSEIGSVFIEAKRILEEGKQVLFCGTPCQVGGIKAFLEKEYENLITVDFICHGVPTPLAWNKYLDLHRNRERCNVKNASFRNKDNGWKRYSMKIEFSNGAEYKRNVIEDFYLRSFISSVDLRPSCYQCKFKQIHRKSDITLADFWGVEKVIGEWDDDRGVSLIMQQSKRGSELLNKCSNSLDLIEVNYDSAIAYNSSMTESVKKTMLRNSFMKRINKIPFDKLCSKYCGSGYFSKIRRKILNSISV